MIESSVKLQKDNSYTELLFFFLLLTVIFLDCGFYKNLKDSFLLFYLNLVVLICNWYID